MLTIFTTCKQFKGSARAHQTNALMSWRYCVPRPHVIIYGMEAGVYDICQRMGAEQRGGVERVDDLPLLDSMFKRAQEDSPTDLIAYTNSDIMHIDGLPVAVDRAAERFPDGFLGVCRRWDLTFDEEYPFHGDWRAWMKKLISRQAVLHSRCSSDVFAFKRPLWDLPAFAVGRPGWDNWCMWRATQEGWPVVDMTPVVTLAHPLHGYGPNASMNVLDFWRDNPLSKRNADLMGSDTQYCFKHVAQAGALWRMSETDIYHVAEEGSDPATV